MNIHFFNPGHETAVLNQSLYYTAPASISAMQRELAFLPAWYANADDSVFVWDKTDTKYWKYLSENISGLPLTIDRKELNRLSSNLCLWGISPQAIHFWEDLNTSYNAQVKVPVWKDEYVLLTSRQMARNCLLHIQKDIPEIEDVLIPSFYTSLAEIEERAADTSYQLLAKAPYSSSGRGLLWLPIDGLTRTERQILHGMLKKQGSVSIEKALNKKLDFAMEFMSDGVGSVSLAGYSLFETNTKGAYLSNIIKSQQAIIEHITSYVSSNLLSKVCKVIETFLSNEYGSLYQGCIGIDMLIYLSDDGEFRIHPCVEINMRYNMGYLALELSRKHIHENASGRFYIDFSSHKEEIYNQHLKLTSEHPAEFINKKLRKGYLPLCPVNSENHFWAYVLVD